MKIIIVGASGTMGKHLTSAFEKENEVITAASEGCDLQVDITSTESIENMFKKVGPFDALISTAGPTFVGPWKKLTDDSFRQGVDGKMMGQINLVLIGQTLHQSKGILYINHRCIIARPTERTSPMHLPPTVRWKVL